MNDTYIMITDLFTRHILKKPYKKTVFLAGCGGSGTTWLAELINLNHDYRYVFEPFHNQFVNEWSSFLSRQYLRGDEKNPEIIAAMENILRGRINYRWTDKYWDGEKKSKLLIKDIRANLVLKWIKNHYPDIHIIFLIRHPGAVIESRLNLGWDAGLNMIFSQPLLVRDYLQPFIEMVNKPGLTFLQRNAIMWCIENYIPLKQCQRGEIQVVFYEDLVADTVYQLKTISRYIREPFHPELLEAVGKPSALTKKSEDSIADKDELICSWSKRWSDEQKNILMEILKIFDLDQLYDTKGMPRPFEFV